MNQIALTSQTRRPQRRSVNLRGFALGGSIDADILVSDLSYDGCQLRSTQPLKPGDAVELRITRYGAANGEVRWVAHDRAGVRFIPESSK